MATFILGNLFAGPAPRKDWDKKDDSRSKSWSKSRGHKSHGKGGHKHGNHR